MTQHGTTTRTRRAKPSHEEWTPLPYMGRAVNFLTGHLAAGLPLAPGGRKTSITLAAFVELQRQGRARTMLVVAPLRVCRQTWPAEIRKWTQFKHLKCVLLHGPKKDKRLTEDGDVYLINPEGCTWLAKKFFGRPLPFDVVCIDELTKFKNAQSKRSKDLRPRMKGVSYRWGLTGSLKPNTHMDLFGQQLMLDDGAALGRYITHYRDKYFHADWTGFNYDLNPGAEAKIAERLAPTWFYMDPSDYSQLPDVVDDVRDIELSPDDRRKYDKLKKDLIVSLPEGQITAANTAACYAKLAQMANGMVYGETHDELHFIHDQKIEVIDELAEELGGEQLLIGYEFNHDIARIKKWHEARYSKPLPYLGKGTTAAQESEWIAAWNRGELPVLAAHPASAGHGLNMQESNAQHVAWFSVPWDWELYDQFIRRVRRSGNQAAQVFNHLLIVKETIDEQKLAAQKHKDLSGARLLRVLNEYILREGAEPTGEDEMVQRLSRPEAAAATEAPAGWGAPPAQSAPEPQTTAAPAGWGAPLGAAASGDQQQRERIQEQIAPQGNGSFSGSVAQQKDTVSSTDYGETAPAGWAAQQEPAPQQQQQSTEAAPAGWAAPPTPPAPQHQDPSAKPAPKKLSAAETDKSLAKMTKAELLEYVTKLQSGDVSPDNGMLYSPVAAACVSVVFSDPATGLEDGLEMVRDMVQSIRDM